MTHDQNIDLGAGRSGSNRLCQFFTGTFALSARLMMFDSSPRIAGCRGSYKWATLSSVRSTASVY